MFGGFKRNFFFSINGTGRFYTNISFGAIVMISFKQLEAIRPLKCHQA
jgi:hypothetical protein